MIAIKEYGWMWFCLSRPHMLLDFDTATFAISRVLIIFFWVTNVSSPSLGCFIPTRWVRYVPPQGTYISLWSRRRYFYPKRWYQLTDPDDPEKHRHLYFCENLISHIADKPPRCTGSGTLFIVFMSVLSYRKCFSVNILVLNEMFIIRLFRENW